MTFKAFQVDKTETGYRRAIVTREDAQLPEGDLLIQVQYSSLNYKDGLSATGNPGVTRRFPHTPGIDAAGVVLDSATDEFAEGDEIIAIGFDLGMNTWGGFAERIRIPAAWAVKLPKGLSLHESMILGTAGFTAAACVLKLEQAGMTPASGPVLVTGATGGVGSVAVKLLAKLGYEVTAVTGKDDQHAFLRSLGASDILSREALAEGSERVLLAERWGGVVDTVGGAMLVSAVKGLRYGCSLAACGMVASPSFEASVFPFILRHVNLLGVDSVQLPLAQKAHIWHLLANDWHLHLADLEEPLTLETLSGAMDRILVGNMVGRGVVHL